MATERIGRAVLELVSDSGNFKADIEKIKREATTALPNAFKQARGSLDTLATGMSAAGKEASASSKLIAGMSSAGQQAAQGLSEVPPHLQLMQKGSELLRGSWLSLTASFGAGAIVGTVVSGLAQSIGEAVREGTRLPVISKSFDQLTASVGQSGAEMLSVTKSATKGLIGDLDLMQSANKAILLGLPVTSTEMGKLSAAATVLGRAMGQDATSSLNDLITALGRSSPLILDNLGLTVKVGEANEKYAKQLGKPVAELNEAEKKTAFYNAAMETASDKVNELGGVHLTASDQVARLGVALSNNIAKFVATANESGILSKSIGFLADAYERASQNATDLEEINRRRVASGGKENPSFEDLDTERTIKTTSRPGVFSQVPMLGSPTLGGTDWSKNAAALTKQTDELAQKLAKDLNPPLLVTAERTKEWAFWAGKVAGEAMPAVVSSTGDVAASLANTLVPATQLSQEALNGLILTAGGQSTLAGAQSQDLTGGGGSTVFSSWQSDVENLAGSFVMLAQVSGGVVVQGIGRMIGAISAASTGFDSMKNGIKAMTSGGGLSGILGGFTSIVGGIGGIVAAASAAVAGIRALFNAFKSEESLKVNKPRDAFFDQYGGYEGLAQKLTAASDGNIAEQLIRTLYDADTESKFHSAEDAIIALIGGQKFARGGIAMRPLLGMVGDNGPEAVIPLNRLRDLVPSQDSNPSAIVSAIERLGRRLDQQTALLPLMVRDQMLKHGVS